MCNSLPLKLVNTHLIYNNGKQTSDCLGSGEGLGLTGEEQKEMGNSNVVYLDSSSGENYQNSLNYTLKIKYILLY